jgi:hypothetical protein
MIYIVTECDICSNFDKEENGKERLTIFGMNNYIIVYILVGSDSDTVRMSDATRIIDWI